MGKIAPQNEEERAILLAMFHELKLTVGEPLAVRLWAVMERWDMQTTGRRGSPKACYQNAFRRASGNECYVEGFATIPDTTIPTLHAWVGNPANLAGTEVTWKSKGLLYVGLVPPWEAVFDVYQHTREHGFILGMSKLARNGVNTPTVNGWLYGA